MNPPVPTVSILMHNRAATVTVLISCRSLNRSFRIDTNIFQIIFYRFHRRKFSEIYGYMGGRTALAINNNISKFQLGKAFPTAFSSNRLLCAGIPLNRTLCCNPCCIRNTRSAYPVSGTMCSNTHIFQCGSFPSLTLQTIQGCPCVTTAVTADSINHTAITLSQKSFAQCFPVIILCHNRGMILRCCFCRCCSTPYYNCRQQNTCDQLLTPCNLKLQCLSSNLLQLCYLTITYSNKNQRLFQEKCAKKFHFYLIFYAFLIFLGLNLLEIIFHIIRNK